MLIESLVNNDKIETEKLNERAENVDKLEDADNINKEYKKSFVQKGRASSLLRIIKVKYVVGFSKKEKFMKLVANFKIHKGTMIFKINVFKLIQKYPGLEKSSVTLRFLKNYFKDIKRISQQNSSKFE